MSHKGLCKRRTDAIKKEEARCRRNGKESRRCRHQKKEGKRCRRKFGFSTKGWGSWTISPGRKQAPQGFKGKVMTSARLAKARIEQKSKIQR
eukprot:1137943-Pelagomonas_calceolata.AAC.1